jgi:hypothetical protein
MAQMEQSEMAIRTLGLFAALAYTAYSESIAPALVWFSLEVIF